MRQQAPSEGQLDSVFEARKQAILERQRTERYCGSFTTTIDQCTAGTFTSILHLIDLGLQIKAPISRNEVAARIGCHDRTIRRTCSLLQSLNLITVSGLRILPTYEWKPFFSKLKSEIPFLWFGVESRREEVVNLIEEVRAEGVIVQDLPPASTAEGF